MSGWASGYVADIDYVEGYYPAQAPSRFALACLLGGVEASVPGPDEDVHYLELGSGRGLNALVTAAANPGWRVTAIDFNPAHVAAGVAVARAARLGNVRFLEADLATLAGSELGRSVPAADYVTMHGLWTWVGPEVRAGIVRLLADRLVAGGALQVGFNAMPAWQGALAMQRLIFESGRRQSVRSDEQAIAGLAVARDVLDAGARFLVESPLPRELLDRNSAMSPHYLSHEYMNMHWRPVYHAELAADLAAAKLDWVASSAPLENFPELMLGEAQRAVVARHGDPIMRELVKDMFMPRQFRQDVFVRGPRRVPPASRDASLGALTLAPVRHADEMETTLGVPAGRAEMGEVLARLVARASEGAATVAALLATEPGRSNPCELAGTFVGSGQGAIATGPEGWDPDAPATRLNRVLAGRVRSLRDGWNNGALACPRLGTGYHASLLERFIAGRLLDGEREDRVDRWVETLSADAGPDDREKIAGFAAEAVTRRVPVMRALGLVPA